VHLLVKRNFEPRCLVDGLCLFNGTAVRTPCYKKWIFPKILFWLKYQTVANVQQPSNGKCNTPSSEPLWNQPRPLVIVMWSELKALEYFIILVYRYRLNLVIFNDMWQNLKQDTHLNEHNFSLCQICDGSVVQNALQN
jgi:hypothetical protein